MQNVGHTSHRQPDRASKEPSPLRGKTKLFRGAGRLLLLSVEFPFRYIFGSDIFISYKRRDSREYAPNLALEVQRQYKERHGRTLSFYLDRWIAPPTGQLPLSLRLQLRWSSMLVVVCTEGAVESAFVKDEVARYANLGRKVLTVDVDGAFEKVREQEPWVSVGGADPEVETLKLVKSGKPSQKVIERVIKMVEFTSQARRLRRAVLGTLALVALSIAYSVFTVRDAEAKAVKAEEKAATEEQKALLAEDRARKADKRVEDADRAVGEAQKREQAALTAEQTAKGQKAEAERQRQAALGEKRVAQADAERARGEKERADTAAALARSAEKTALAARDQARGQAEEQARIAEEQKTLAEKAAQLRRRALENTFNSGASRIDAALKDLELLQPAVAEMLHTYAEAEQENLPIPIPEKLNVALTDALRNAKEQGPSMTVGIYPRVTKFDISPAGSLLITVGFPRPENRAREQPAAMLWDVRTQQLLWELPSAGSKVTSCAISPDSGTVAVGFENGEVKLFSVGGAQVTPRRTLTFPPDVRMLKYTADGKSLVVWAGGNSWTGKNLFVVGTQGYRVTPVSLPDNPRLFKFGDGMIDLNRAQHVPRFVGVFDLSLNLTVVDMEEGKITPPYRLTHRRIVKHTGELVALETAALSPDGRWLAAITDVLYKQQQSTLLFDLHCVAAEKSKCVTTYLLPPPLRDGAKAEVAFDPTGNLLLVRETQRRLRVYNMNDVRASRADKPAMIETPAKFTIKGFTPDKKHVILLINNGRKAEPRELQTYDLSTLRMTANYSLDPREPYWDNLKLWQALGGRFQVGLTAATLHVWEQDAAPGEQLLYQRANVGIDLGGATDATIAPDGKLVASAHPSGYIAVWRLADRALLGVIRGLRGEGVLIEWGRENGGQVLYAASRSGQLLRWTPDNTLTEMNVPQTIKEITELQVSKDGRTVAVYGADGPVGVQTGDRWEEVPVTGRPVALSGDGLRLAVALSGGGASVIDVKTKQLLAALQPRRLIPCSAGRVSFALDDTRVVAECNGVVVWDSRGGPPLTEEGPPGELPSKVEVGSTAGLWAGYENGSAYIVDLENGKPSARLEWLSRAGKEVQATALEEGLDVSLGGRSTVFDFAPSTNLVAAGSRDGGLIHVWRLNSGEAVSHIPVPGAAKRISFLPGGDALLAISPQGIPLIVPLDAKRQFLALCPLFWSTINRQDTRRGAYDLCREMFEQAESGRTPPQLPVWILEAVPRSTTNERRSS